MVQISSRQAWPPSSARASSSSNASGSARSQAASLVAEASGASVHALQHGPSPTAPNGLGVCVTGMMRTLMAEPVVDSFDRYIRQTAHDTDVHMVISVENGTDPYSFGSGGQMDRDQLTRRIRASWQPDSLVLMPSHDVEPWQCDIMPSLDYPSREAGTWDTYRAAPQWFAMRVCYGQIERAEEARAETPRTPPGAGGRLRAPTRVAGPRGAGPRGATKRGARWGAR